MVSKIKYPLFIKLILLALILELITGLVIIFSSIAFKQLDEQDIVRQAQVIALENYVLRHDLKHRRKSDNISDFENKEAIINHNTTLIKDLMNELDSNDSVTGFLELNNEFSQAFRQYTEILRERGLNENSGIEGDFRDKVHKVEDLVKKSGTKSKAYVSMLQARRREKDYIMRGKLDYVFDVEQHINDVKENTRNLNISQSDKEQIIVLADEYLESFKKLVDIYNRLDKTEIELTNIEERLQDKIEYIVSEKSSVASNIQDAQIPVFVLSVLLGVILAIVIARSITKPVENLQRATLRLAEGDLKIKVSVSSNDEIGDLAKFFNVMTTNIQKSNETIVNQRTELEEQNTELSSLNATKDKFFSIIAHDLKNPINAFSGISSYLSNKYEDLSELEIRECIDDINHSAKHLYELLENLLTWSRTQRGKIEYHPVTTDLRQIADQTMYLLAVNANNKKIELKNTILDWTNVYVDPNMVNTIIRNLISNAIKFTPEGGSIELGAINNDKNFVEVFVKDNGIGISKENQEKLFRIDVHHTTIGTSDEKGTGLGLILCKEFVEKHGGTIWVESEEGKGTTFKFTLPKIEPENFAENNEEQALLN